MITISNSETFLKKLKKLFTANDELEQPLQEVKEEEPPKEEIEDIPLEVSPSSSDNDLKSIISVLENEQPQDFDCLNFLKNYETISTKNILFKVDKNKFNYPTTKSTTLQAKSNLPIVKNIQYSQEKKQYFDNIQIEDICPAKEVTGFYSIDYTLAQTKLSVDFSILLYSPIDTDITECPKDISNLDIYALEEGSFVDEPFDFCYAGNCVNLTPYDFSVEITPLQQEVSPICEFDDYYLYALGVEIKISFLSPITISPTDTKTLAAINTQLDKDLRNNVFTRGELASITTLDLSNDENLDFDIFQYLFNLTELNISSTTSDPVKLSKLSVLKRLEILYAKNNYLQDYTPFTDLISLKELYLDNDIVGTLAETFTISATSIIMPLTNLVNLRILSLSNNNISELPSDEDLGKLTNLTTLILNNNNIENLSNLKDLASLNELSLENNPINPETIPETIPVTILNLSSTNLTNDGLSKINIPPTLQSLNISNNNLSDLTYLFDYNLTIDATNQTINYGTLEPDIDDSTMFILDLSFLKDVDFTTPNILEISNGGILVDDQSSTEPTIVWQNITSQTEAYFTFTNIDENFTGRVNVTLNGSVSAI